MTNKNKKNKDLLQYVGWSVCVILLFVLTLVGVRFFDAKQEKNYSEQNNKLLDEFFGQLDESYQVIAAPQNATKTFVDSVNLAKNERARVIEDAIIKQMTEQLTRDSQNAIVAEQGVSKTLFLWSAFLAFLIIVSIILAYLGLKSKMSALKNRIMGTSSDSLFNVSQLNAANDYQSYQPINRSSDAPKQIENEPELEEPILVIEEAITREPIFVTKQPESKKEDIVPFIQTPSVSQEVAAPVDYENRLVIAANRAGENDKLTLLEELVEDIKNDTSLSEKRQKTLLYKTRLQLAQLYQMSNNVEKSIELFSELIEISPLESIPYMERGDAYKQLSEYDKAIEDYNTVLDLRPETRVAHFNRGMVYMSVEDYKAAINDFSSALMLNLNDAQSLFYRGIAYFKLDEVNKAISDLNTVIGIDPNYVEAYYDRGMIYYQSKNEYNKAIEDFNTVIKLESDNAEAYTMRGLSYYNMDEYEKAIENFDKSVEINPQDAEVYRNRADAYGQLSDFENAIANYNEALSLDPNLAEMVYDRANAFFHTGDYAKAVSDYDIAIEVNPDNADAYLKRGISYYHQEQYDKAEVDFDTVLQLSPENAEAYRYKGKVLSKKAKPEPKPEPSAVVVVPDEKVAAAATSTFQSNDEATLYFDLAATDFDNNNLRSAVANLDKSLKHDRKNPRAYFMRGMAYSYLKEYDKAIADFDKSLTLSPDSAEVYYNRGNVYTNKQQFDNAIADYSCAIGINPGIPEAYFNRGNIYYNQSQYTPAIADYGKAIELNNEYIKAYFNRGLAYKTTEQYRQGMNDFQIVISLDPTNERLVEKAQKQIDQLERLLEKSQSNSRA